MSNTSLPTATETMMEYANTIRRAHQLLLLERLLNLEADVHNLMEFLSVSGNTWCFDDKHVAETKRYLEGKHRARFEEILKEV